MYYGWKPYVPVAERRKQAEKEIARAKKTGQMLSPVVVTGRSIAKTFWGKAWCDNLEHYSDYANRLPRGRSYVRNGSVIDLNLSTGEIRAQVMGSSLYRVVIRIQAVAPNHWKSISTDCAGSIDSLVELLQGRLSKSVMTRICQPKTGLFPAPQEINHSCSCPDSASMCKHIAAVFYGVGARLDKQPDLLFTLRGVDASALVTQAMTQPPKGEKPLRSKVLDTDALADVFGIEMADAEVEAGLPPPSVEAARRPAVKKKTATPARPAAEKKLPVKEASPKKAKTTTAKTAPAKTPRARAGVKTAKAIS